MENEWLAIQAEANGGVTETRVSAHGTSLYTEK